MPQAPQPLKAYKVNEYLVFATRGTEAKILAAPLIRPVDEWREDVAGWVALRAEREPEMDDMKDPHKTEAYIYNPQ